MAPKRAHISVHEFSGRAKRDSSRSQLGKPPPNPGRFTVLSIQALGPLHIWYGDSDLAPDLLHRRVIGFTWLYLLARAVLKAPITREAMADEGAPGLDPRGPQRGPS